MPLRSAVSSLAVTGAVPAATTDEETFFNAGESTRLSRSPGVHEAAKPTAALPAAPAPAAAPKKPRKPRAPKAVQSAARSDVAATRALVQDVEARIQEVRGQMNKAIDKFQPKLDALRKRHAELSAALVDALTH